MEDIQLNLNELDNVAGGEAIYKKKITTVEEIEEAPFFERFKKLIAAYKSQKDLSVYNNMHDLELRLLAIAKYEYKTPFSMEVCQAFIKKYLPLV